MVKHNPRQFDSSHHVTLSEAKGPSRSAARCFAALSMTGLDLSLEQELSSSLEPCLNLAKSSPARQLYPKESYEGFTMKSLRKAYGAKVVYLSALLLTLFFSIASLVSCTQPEPLYTSINLGIPAAALKSPVKGKLPDSTELNVGITFKIDPRLLNQAGQKRPQPGQPSNPGGIGPGLGIDNGLFQKINAFFQGIDLQLSQFRTYA